MLSTILIGIFLAAEKLVLTQVYDETTYIDSAINLVQQNIYVGGTLAAIVLLLFSSEWLSHAGHFTCNSSINSRIFCCDGSSGPID